MVREKPVAGLQQIQAIIEQEGNRVRREVLEEERARLLQQLASIEARLKGLGGKAPSAPRAEAAATPRKRRRGRKPGGGLRSCVVKALEAAGKELNIAELMPKVVEAGYKTSAKPSNFRIMLVKVLKNGELFKKVSRGVYELKK